MRDEQILKIKDLCLIMGISVGTAQRYLRDIRKEFNIKIVMYYHYKKYFKLL